MRHKLKTQLRLPTKEISHAAKSVRSRMSGVLADWDNWNLDSACGDVLQALQSNQTEGTSASYGPTQFNFCKDVISRNTSGCNFNVSACDQPCLLLGHHQDAGGCADSCDCTTDGLFEGDIKIDENSIHGLLHIYRNAPIRAGTTIYPIWDLAVENGTVQIPFVFGNGIDDKTQNVINQAMLLVEKNTCIKFIPRSDSEDYLEFVKGLGCWSFVGRQGGRQPISIGKGCVLKGIVQHEIMHALGFWHEQSRPDRDQFVQVLHKNIIPGREHNFNIRSNIESYGSPYDFHSITHYHGFAFSKNNKPTLVDKKTKKAIRAQIEKLSEQDIIQINRRYNCENRGE